MRVGGGSAALATLLAVTTSSLIAITSIAGASRIESVAAADPVGVATSVDGPDRNDVVTITVPIDVVPGSPDIARRVKKLAKTWESQAEVGWNNAFEFFQYKCFTLRLDVDMKVRPVGFAGTDDRHLVLVGKEGGGTPGFSGTKERNPSAGSKDGTRSFDGARDGIWREDQSEAVTLHEVGHLFGLGDDYDVVVDPSTGEPVEPRQTRPKPGRGGTLMGDGGVVDQALVDRIGKQIEKLLDGLPGCETWKGTFSGTEGQPRPECVGQVEGSLTLFVSDGGRVSGEGQRTDTPTDPAACQHFGTFTSTVQISGRATRDAFEIFGFTAVDGGPFRIPKSGTRARRDSFVTVQGDPDVYSVELRCVSC